VRLILTHIILFVVCAAVHAQPQASSSALATLSNECEYAADLAHAGRFVEAADHLAGVLTNATHDAALRMPCCDAGEPWLIFWSNCRLYWLQQHDRYDARVADETWRLIDMCAAHAKPDWTAYHWLFDRLLDYYKATHDQPGLRAVLLRRFSFDCANPYYLICLLRDYSPAEQKAIAAAITRFRRAGGREFPELLLFQARLARNLGGDPFQPAIDVLALAPQVSFMELKVAIELARVGVQHDATIRSPQYYTVVCRAVSALPRDDGFADLLALLLAEKSFLEEQPALRSDERLCALARSVVQAVAGFPGLDAAQQRFGQLSQLDAALAGYPTADGTFLCFTNLLGLPCVPDRIYQVARALIDQQQYGRALPMFELMCWPENPDGFSRGNAYYFVAHIQDVWQAKPVAAFTNYLRVQQFPACLVFTADAYYQAARQFATLGLREHAVALVTVEVPTVDMITMEYARHTLAYDLCRGLNDPTNALYHLQALLMHVPNMTAEVSELLARNPQVEQLWNGSEGTFVCAAIQLAIIERALSHPARTPDDALFMDALTHKWPTMRELPLAVSTNRVLNNNIFDRRSIGAHRNPK